MPQIKFRIYNGSAGAPEIARRAIGEPFWDPINSKLGIWNNRAGQIEWFPRIIGNKFIMNQSQQLIGLDSNSAENAIRMDWNTPGELRLIDSVSSLVVARFGAAGTVFDSAASMTTGLPSFANKLLNGNLSVIASEATDVGVDTLIDSANIGAGPKVMAPNCLFWRTSGSLGHATAQIITSDVPNSRFRHSIRVVARSAPTSLGIRAFMFGAKEISGQTVTASAYVKGPNGAQTKMRVCTAEGTIVSTLTITATGSWVQHPITFTAPSGTEWLSFDYLYNPSFNTGSIVEWKAAGAQINLGSTPATYEYRPEATERALLIGSFSDGLLRYDTATGHLYPLNFYNLAGVSGANIRAFAKAANAGVTTISEKERRGFKVSLANFVVNTPVNISVAAFLMPVTADTN